MVCDIDLISMEVVHQVCGLLEPVRQGLRNSCACAACAVQAVCEAWGLHTMPCGSMTWSCYLRCWRRTRS